MIRADLHAHTTYSSDSSISPKTIIEQLHKHPAIKAVAITDHNTAKGYHIARELARAYEDILVIPAVEISAIEGDLLVLGVAELPPNPWRVEDVIDFARERGGVAVAAHPFRAYGLGESAKNYDLDAIEVLNGASALEVNKVAEILARDMSLPGVAGTDAHKVDELWTVFTEIQASSDVDEILKAIKMGLVRATSTEKSIRF